MAALTRAQARLQVLVLATVRLAPIAVIAAATLLRFADLGQAQLFRDEASSWVLANYPVGSLLDHNAGKTYPPLYGLLLRAWMLVFGAGESALRSPSAIPGVVTVAVAWRWTSQALGRGAGLMVAAMLTTSTLLLANGREARMYSLETAFATIAWWLSWRVATDALVPARRRRLAAAAVVLACAVAGEVWTMAFGLPTAGLQFLFVLVCYTARRRRSAIGGHESTLGPRVAIGAIAVGVASLSFWLPSLLTIPLSNQSFWTPTPDLISLHDTFYVFLGVTGDGLSAMAPAAATLLAVAGLAGLAVPKLMQRSAKATGDPGHLEAGPIRRAEETWRVRMFGVAAVLGTGLVAVIWLYSQHEPVYDARYLGAAGPPLAALIAAGLVEVARLSRSRIVAAVLAAAVLGPMSVGAVLEVDRLNADVGSDPGRQTAQLLVAMVRPGDVVLTLDARTYFPLDYYLTQTAGDSVASRQLFDWNPPGEPFYLGTSLIAPERLIDPAAVSGSGWQTVLPGLRPGGTIWLVTIANGNAADLGLSPLSRGPLLEQSGATVFVTPVDGNVGQIRPMVVSPPTPA